MSVLIPLEKREMWRLRALEQEGTILADAVLELLTELDRLQVTELGLMDAVRAEVDKGIAGPALAVVQAFVEIRDLLYPYADEARMRRASKARRNAWLAQRCLVCGIGRLEGNETTCFTSKKEPFEHEWSSAQ